ncbi:MAG: hypothetical protein WA417_22570 [Stellaceae bacterium]|jgi:hypothetical protein
MTLFDVEELTHYWIEHPPLHLIVAAYLGFGKNKRKRVTAARIPAAAGAAPVGDVGNLLAELGPGFGSGDVHAGLAPVVLDMAELRRRTKPTS